MIALGGILVAMAPSRRNDSAARFEAHKSKADAAPAVILERTNFALESVSKRTTAETSPQPTSSNLPAPDRLAKRLFLEYPELDPKSDAFHRLSDWDKVVRLRDFSYRHTAFAGWPCHDARRSGAAMVRKVQEGKATLADAYQFFDEARGGVTCREAAELLQLLYAWAGFEAEYLEIGVSPQPRRSGPTSHALTLVRVSAQKNAGQPRSILSIHDPSVNLSYGDSQQNPIDYFDMLELLRRQQAGEIRFIGEIPGANRRSAPITVAFNADLERTRPTDFAKSWSLPAAPVWSANAHGQWSVRAPRSISAFERLGEATWKSDLYGAGLPPETVYLHCFPIAIRGTANSSSLLQRAQAILGMPKVAMTHAVGHDS